MNVTAQPMVVVVSYVTTTLDPTLVTVELVGHCKLIRKHAQVKSMKIANVKQGRESLNLAFK